MSTLRYFACFAGLAIALITAAEVHASTVHAPPSAPCDSDHIMDLAINSHGIWFECICERLTFTGDVCDWYELGPAPDAAAIRRRSWRYVPRATLRSLLVKHSWPRYLDPPRRITAPAPVKPVAGIATGVATTTGKCTDPFLADDAWAQAHGC
jgi:hypothetical protein